MNTTQNDGAAQILAEAKRRFGTRWAKSDFDALSVVAEAAVEKFGADLSFKDHGSVIFVSFAGRKRLTINPTIVSSPEQIIPQMTATESGSYYRVTFAEFNESVRSNKTEVRKVLCEQCFVGQPVTAIVESECPNCGEEIHAD